jgi:membrane fusion protein, multidrug efflux system
MKIRVRATRLVTVGCAIVFLSGCGEPQSAQISEAKVPPKVAVVTLRPSPRPIVRELPGRIVPMRVAEVRARVAGIVMERLFQQGADVKAGDILYRIDPARFEVELSSAHAALAKAHAVLEQAEKHSKRIEKLAEGRVASQAQHDIGLAALRQAQADVSARQADVARAKLDLDYTVVRSPINGRIGPALVTEGALVGQGEATHLTTVQQLDHIYADFTQSVSELRQLRRDLESGALERISPDTAKVRLVLDDGAVYPYVGRLLFSDASVDRSTSQVTLRGEFPNPKHELLPGMYVRIRIEQGIDGASLAVPQQSVRHNSAGGNEVYVLRTDNQAVAQPIRLGRLSDEQWLVLEGLKPGDRVVVEGFQKFASGDVVDPVPWEARGVSASSANQPALQKIE